MAMWADNVKFVKDIVDSKYNKIDQAAAEVNNIIVQFCVLSTKLHYYVQ